MEAETLQLQERLKLEKRATGEQGVRLARKIRDLKEGNRLKVAQIAALERMQELRQQRMAIMQQRGAVLEEIIKVAETLLITLDSSFNEVISKSRRYIDTHPGFKPLTRGKLDDISERKKNHQECLLDLRRAYENETRQLQHYDLQIKRQQTRVAELAAQDRFSRADEEGEESITEAADLRPK